MMMMMMMMIVMMMMMMIVMMMMMKSYPIDDDDLISCCCLHNLISYCCLQHERRLREKITLMSLVDLISSLPAEERRVSFAGTCLACLVHNCIQGTCTTIYCQVMA